MSSCVNCVIHCRLETNPLLVQYAGDTPLSRSYYERKGHRSHIYQPLTEDEAKCGWIGCVLSTSKSTSKRKFEPGVKIPACVFGFEGVNNKIMASGRNSSSPPVVDGNTRSVENIFRVFVGSVSRVTSRCV